MHLPFTDQIYLRGGSLTEGHIKDSDTLCSKALEEGETIIMELGYRKVQPCYQMRMELPNPPGEPKI